MQRSSGLHSFVQKELEHGQRPSGLHRQAMKGVKRENRREKKSPSSGQTLGGRHAPLFSCRGKMVTKGMASSLGFWLLALSRRIMVPA